ncbi:MAG TPA: hypothetical protein VMT38_08815 [Terracidiphilus sp.]|nr:hypothetical protein [Terracidiphilus sp.]
MRCAPAFRARFLRVALCLIAIPALAQTTPAPSQSAPGSSPDQQPHGKVIFSRSVDDKGQTTSTASPAAGVGGRPVKTPVATDAERQALTFTSFDMDVHLRPAAQQIAVRCDLIVRNDGESPLVHIPLQISSSLDWETIRLARHDVPFTVATLNSDVDHTGQLHEAAVDLNSPLAPGATLELDVTYSGTIPQSAQRLTTIGTPADAALRTDWDAIAIDFTGLRGFGNVVWYPASSVPVILGDGARVFDEMGEHKLRISGAHFRLQLTEEFSRGRAPTVALINGHRVPLTLTEPSTAAVEVAGIASANLDLPEIGFEAPSLFLAVRDSHQAANTTLYTNPEDDSAVEAWASAAAFVTPFLQGWLGPTPRSELTILDLPDSDDAPFETGALLVTAVGQGTQDQLDGVFAHALTHAWMSSPRAWLSEGVANFMGTLWIEKQQGRQKALESLESGRTALALAEPASPGESAGQPLAQAISPVYYRTKACYVFWMLRDLIGDAALSAALRAYSPDADAAGGLGPASTSNYFEKLLTQASAVSGESSSLGPAPNSPRDLVWFFSDWIDADKGLPDVAIDNVFPSHTEGDNWLVAIEIANSGYAAAEIPVTVSNPQTSVTQRVVVPARGNVTQRILIQGEPEKVQANDGTVPETEASVHVRTLGEASDSSNPSNSLPLAVH